MKKVSLAEQDDLLKIVKKHEKKLENYDGVSGVSLGYVVENGKMNFDKIGILVFVPRKFKPELLDPSQIIPKELDGLKVDVIQTNPVPHATNDRFNPLVGGIYISNSRLSGGGTLSMIFKEVSSGKAVGMSNWHVLKDRRGKAGDAVVQPAWLPANATNTVGNLSKWDEILDCAYFTCNTSRSVSSPDSMYQITGKVTQSAAPVLGTAVMKSGARTGVTHGVISSISSDQIDITLSPNPNKPDPNNEISLPGDSGSLWITDEATPQAVALHWGGDGENTPQTEYSYARNISNILAKLGLTYFP